MIVFFGVTGLGDMDEAATLNMIEDEDAIMVGGAFEVRIGARMMQAMP